MRIAQMTPRTWIELETTTAAPFKLPATRRQSAVVERRQSDSERMGRICMLVARVHGLETATSPRLPQRPQSAIAAGWAAVGNESIHTLICPRAAIGCCCCCCCGPCAPSFECARSFRPVLASSPPTSHSVRHSCSPPSARADRRQCDWTAHGRDASGRKCVCDCDDRR